MCVCLVRIIGRRCACIRGFRHPHHYIWPAVYGPDKLVPAGGSSVPLAPVGSLAFYSDHDSWSRAYPPCSFSAVLLLLLLLLQHTRSDHATLLPPMSPAYLAAHRKGGQPIAAVTLHLAIFTLCDLGQLCFSFT